MNRISKWLEDSKNQKRFPKLNQNLETDVVIIGGGITGVLSAYLLSKKGKKVILVEKNKIGSGDTGFTTAFITNVIDLDLQEIVKRFGKDKALLVWSSGLEVVNKIEKIINEENVACEFQRCPAYIYTNSDKDIEFLKNETDLASSLNFNVKFKQHNDLNFKNLAYMQVENQAKFHPLKFINSLTLKVGQNGCQIYEDSEVKHIEESDEEIKVIGDEFCIKSKYIISATHHPLNSSFNIFSRLIPCTSYVAEFKVSSLDLVEGIYWDTDEPYHYFRIDKNNDYQTVILGGEDHKTGQANEKDPFKCLEEYFKKVFHNVSYEVLRTWSGQVLETIDGLPYFGRVSKESNNLIATGFAGNGMTFGPMSAFINTDIILDNENMLIETYSSTRLKGLKDFIKGGISEAKEFIKGHTSAGLNENIEDIKPDSGKVVTIGLKKFAVYKDSNGKILKLSPICTHMKCIVQWNDSDKSWDCPCHGSRFGKNGEVLRGPATEPLKKE